MKQVTISTLVYFTIVATLAALESMPTPDLMTPLVSAFNDFETIFKN